MTSKLYQVNRMDSDFFSHGVRCSGWLYLPQKSVNPPIVVMGPFLGAEKTFKLPDYAGRFAQQGLAVFLFDYRNFGASDGEPRNLINPWRHLQDWRAALIHVRNLPEIDASRLALWGSSLAGGHVLKIAAEEAQVTAVVSQVPAVDGLASAMLKDWRYLSKAIIAGLRDIISSLFLGKPYWIPIVASPENFAILNTAECESGYNALVDKSSAWQNKAPARFCLALPFYRPIHTAQRIKCPTLLLLAEADSLIPAKAVEKTAAKITNATLVRLPYDHFTPYLEEHFEENVRIMSDFLVANLLKQ